LVARSPNVCRERVDSLDILMGARSSLLNDDEARSKERFR